MDYRPIIIIDDDKEDLGLLQEAFAALKVVNEIIIFNQGSKFLEYIKTTAQKSFFILCDINMGEISGMQLKKKIFDDERLRIKCIPFLFLSTSGAAPSVNTAYSYNVQGYFIKPDSFEKLKDMLRSMIEYWGHSQHPNS